MRFFPNQDIPEIDKDFSTANGKAFYKQVGDYAEFLHQTRAAENEKISRMMDAFNGIGESNSVQWLTHYFGKKNKAEYLTYKHGRTKCELLVNECLKRPIKSTIETINLRAKEEKMYNTQMLKGAMHGREELAKLKEIGVDVMNGVPIPQSEDDPLWDEMSDRDKEEMIMQILANQKIQDLDIPLKISKQFLNLILGSIMYGKIEIDQNAEVQFHEIDPRNGIWEEIAGDTFMERGNVKGAIYPMTAHEILLKYGDKLSIEDKRKVEEMRTNPDKYTELSKGRIRRVGHNVEIDVMHIEFKSSRPEYYALSERSNKQAELNSETDLNKNYYKKEIKPEIYEKNKAKYTGTKVQTKYKEDLREMTRIGGIIDVCCDRKEWQMRSEDSPAYILDSSYVGYLHNTVNGVRVSLYENIENIDKQIDIVMYQLLRDIARSKGKALFYDRSWLPKGISMEQVMYKLAEQGFVDVSSSSFLNQGGRDADITAMIKEIDLGLSTSFAPLLQFKDQLLNMMDRLTGINDAREGNTSASETVTNNMSNLQSSRTITEGYFYGAEMFTGKVMDRIVAATKITYAFYKIEEGKQVLGLDNQSWLEITQELGYKDYAAHMQSGQKYLEMKQKFDRWAEYAMNSKQASMLDLFNMEISETLAEQRTILAASVKKMEMMAQQEAQANRDSQERMNQQNNEAKNAMQDKLINAGLGTELQKIDTKGNKQMEIDDNKAHNEMVKDQNKSDNELFATKK